MADPQVNVGFFARHRTICSCLIISLGGIVFGIDGGIFATTIAHETFKRYFFGPSKKNNPLLGAMNSTYAGGQCVGSLTAGWVMSQFGRKQSLFTASIVSIISAVIMTTSINPGMMIAGRILIGTSTGALLSIMPAYISEIAPPEQRALLVGMMGMSDAIGFMLANWIGYGGSFATGNSQWRIPLAMQIPVGIVLVFLILLLPQSPRWLVQKGRINEAHDILRSLHQNRGEAYVIAEMTQIEAQLKMEAEDAKGATVMNLIAPRYLRRTATSAYMMCITQLAGAGVIQSYQSLFYAGLGFKGRTILLISGCYGIMGPLGQGINLLAISDKWPRTRTMWVGCLVLATMLSILMPLSKYYGSGQNLAGSGAGVAFIFLFSGLNAMFLNSTTFVIAAEILPTHLRSYGMGFALFCKGATSIWLSQATPVAFAAIQWRFYAVFISTLLFGVCFCAFLLPETNQLTLEDIGETFGDRTATSSFGDVLGNVGESKLAQVPVTSSEHVETTTDASNTSKSHANPVTAV